MIAWWYRWQHQRQVEKMWRLVVEWVHEYRLRCTGENRFLISPDILHQAFPEFDLSVVYDVWQRLIEKRMIDRDPLDGEMCVR